MFMPSVPKRPADVYTVRFAEVEAQTSLSMSLRKLATAAGGTFLINLIDGPGFVFTMPTTAPSPLTSYLHGGLLEEGCVHISKTTLEKEEPVSRHTKYAPSSMDEDSSDAESVEEDNADHPSLKMQWNWTELKADKKG